MTPLKPEDCTTGQSATDLLVCVRDRDLELADLYIILAQSLTSLQDYERAAMKADLAVLLAQKWQDRELLGAALFEAGIGYTQHRNYVLGLERFTEALNHTAGLFHAQVQYNRAHVYMRQTAYSFAASDLEAVRLCPEIDATTLKMCRINLAWSWIMLREFQRAEAVLVELTSVSGAESDRAITLQVAHDRAHMSFLSGDCRTAFKQALQLLRRASAEYPHIRARTALILMSMAAEGAQPEEASMVGIFVKRLAAKAKRPDIGDEANRRLWALDLTDTEPVAKALERISTSTPRSRKTRKAAKVRKAGGVT